MMSKREPGALTPWNEINRLLGPEERFLVSDGLKQHTELAPRERSRLTAVLFVCHQAGLSVTIDGFIDAAVPEEKEHSLVISLRALNRIDVQHIDSGVIGVEAGCLPKDLNSRLFSEGYESGLVDSKVTLGAFIARDGCFEEVLGGIAPRDRLLGAELVTTDGAQLMLGGRTLASAGPSVHQTLWGEGGEIGIINYICWHVTPIPAVRLRLAWSFDDKEALLVHADELQKYTSTWEKLDLVLPGNANEKGFVLAQIAGVEEELELFKNSCPKMALAQTDNMAHKLENFLVQGGYQFQQLRGLEGWDRPPPGVYHWVHRMTGRWKCVERTRERRLNE